MKFTNRLNALIKMKKSYLCVGLDSELEKLPSHFPRKPASITAFNREIIEATKDLAIAYKCNIAFYESHGAEGWMALEKTLEYIPRDVLVIADAKRADIGNTSRQYARTFFETFSFDAITVAPYMGFDSVAPFLEYGDKGIFVLVLTSNPGSRDFQYLSVGGQKLFQRVAMKVKEWNAEGNLGIVAGATHPEELSDLRKILPTEPFLIPGVGAQGGEVSSVLHNALPPSLNAVLINSSRGIIFASNGKDFAEKAREKAMELVRQFRSLIALE